MTNKINKPHEHDHPFNDKRSGADRRQYKKTTRADTLRSQPSEKIMVDVRRTKIRGKTLSR
jgi:hypothetical protein